MTDDADFIEAVILLAEMSTASEMPGSHRDDEMDTLVMAARKIRDREGYYVEHSVTEPRYGQKS